MPDRVKLPAGVEVRSYGNRHEAWRGSVMLRSGSNKLEVEQWAEQHAETLPYWMRWLDRDTHEWNGVQQL